MTQSHPWLIAGGMLSLTAALVHIACIFGGADWFRFFGAGDRMARMVEAGQWTPAVFAVGIAALLTLAAAYAFSGAGIIVRLPLVRTGLIVISAVYLARGLIILKPSAMARPDLSANFLFWSSLIVLTPLSVIHPLNVSVRAANPPGLPPSTLAPQVSLSPHRPAGVVAAETVRSAVPSPSATSGCCRR